ILPSLIETRPHIPDFITVFKVYRPTWIQICSHELSELQDIVVVGQGGNVDPNVFAGFVRQLDRVFPGSPFTSCLGGRSWKGPLTPSRNRICIGHEVIHEADHLKGLQPGEEGSCKRLSRRISRSKNF